MTQAHRTWLSYNPGAMYVKLEHGAFELESYLHELAHFYQN